MATSTESILAENLARLRAAIAAAAAASGRSESAVRLVGVTKYVEPEIARQLFSLGVTDLGESRPQELWRKAAVLGAASSASSSAGNVPGPAVNFPRWHFVGHLQRNKIPRTLPLVSLFQSGDSLRVLEALHLENSSLTASSTGNVTSTKLPVLLEVNISGDESKQGFGPAEIEPLLPQLQQLTSLQICGLMGMSGLNSTANEAQAQFASLRELRDRLQKIVPAEMNLAELSMGMSDDFPAAIAEGSTMVRIGSALFEGLPK